MHQYIQEPVIENVLLKSFVALLAEYRTGDCEKMFKESSGPKVAEVSRSLSEVEGRCHVPELHNMGVRLSKPYLARNDYDIVIATYRPFRLWKSLCVGI